MDGQPMSFMSRIGDLPEPEEIFTAYETQKNVINQLKEQVDYFFRQLDPSRWKPDKSSSTLNVWKKIILN